MMFFVIAALAAADPLGGVPVAIAPGQAAPAVQAAANGKAAGLQPTSPDVDAGGVVIKTWGFLRQTTDQLGSRTQDVLRVREDLKDMSADIATQRVAWSKASAELANQNRVLEAQVAASAVDSAGPQAAAAQAATQVTAAQEDTRIARQNRTTLELAWQGQQKAHLAQVAALNGHIQQVSTETTLAKESFNAAMLQAKLSKSNLQAQVAALQLQIQQMQQQEAALDRQAAHNATLLQDQQLFLQRQGEAVKVDLPKVQAEVMKVPSLMGELPALQADLAQVQAELAHGQGDCATHTQTLHGVLRAEQAKVANRAGEVARCSSVGAQNAWLEQEIARKCPSTSVFQS